MSSTRRLLEKRVLYASSNSWSYAAPKGVLLAQPGEVLHVLSKPRGDCYDFVECVNSKGQKGLFPYSFLVDEAEFERRSITPRIVPFSPSHIPTTLSAAQELYYDKVNAFGVKLMEILFSKDQGNVLISPLSIHQSIMVLACGASGGTLRSIASALGFDGISSPVQISSIYSPISAHSATTYPFEMANSIWLPPETVLAEPFKRQSSDIFGAHVSPLPADERAAVSAIN